MPYHPLMIGLALVAALSLAACSEPASPPEPYNVVEVSLSQISADLAAGKTTSVEITQAYIDRINSLDGPLNAVILVAPDALEQAVASDKRWAAGQVRGPMDGVPILLKDNIDAVGMPTTAGSYALEANLPLRDSEVAERLRTAGAVILGKVNTNQFAGLRTTAGLLGSTVGGTPHNPYDLTRSPGGSSNGSAIAAAVSFAAATVGTCTTGSVISPSALNGLVGMRPTIALISRRGIVPVSLTQDTAGPMARTVTDAAMLLTVIAGSDPGDLKSKDADVHKTDYAKGLNVDALKGKRLGVMREMRGYDETTQPVFNTALEVLVAQGAQLVELPTDILEDLSQEDRIVLVYDFKQDLNAYLEETPNSVKVRNLADLIAFNKTDPRESMHSQDLIEAAAATTGRQDPEYVKALEYAKRRAGPEGLDRAFTDYGVDAIVVLTTGPAEKIVPEGSREAGHTISARPKGAAPASPSMNASLAGYPDLTVPMGHVDGLPLGLSFIGPAWSEQMLLSLGYAYEQASHMRVPPPAITPMDSGN